MTKKPTPPTPTELQHVGLKLLTVLGQIADNPALYLALFKPDRDKALLGFCAFLAHTAAIVSASAAVQEVDIRLRNAYEALLK